MERDIIEFGAVLFYFAFLFWTTRLVHGTLCHGLVLEERQARKAYLSLLQKSQEVSAEKITFAAEAKDIFMLYDLTREITRSFDEKEALDIFRSKVAESVPCQDCRLLLPGDEGVAAAKEDPDCTVIPLTAHQQSLGHLVLRGCAPEDQEKVAILSHQLALAIRRDRLYQQVEALATTDSLTGVYTRRYILERFEEEIRRAREHHSMISFLMIDVDFFKHFNDQYGHLTGDQILQKAAGMIRENVREIDVVGRYGGEEFCVVLPETDVQGARYVAERMRQAIAKTVVRAYDAKVRVTVSAGIAGFPAHGMKAHELIDKADWALYRAKKMGRNQVCVFGLYD